MTTTKQYDYLNRLLSTALEGADLSLINSHSYQLNAANQRMQQVFTAGNYVDYTYDNIGQLQTARGKESGGTTNRLHEQLGYGYDAAGNLNLRTNNALVQTFNVNPLNELTTGTRSGTLTVEGTTTGPATNVTVNSQTAALYSDATFAKDGFSLANGTNTFTAIAKDNYGRVDTNVSISYLPSSISFAYDQNGNLTSDGRRCFAYDDENQLASVWVTNAWRSDFVYDGKMRRRIRREYVWSSEMWNSQSEIHYIYDGNLVIQERGTNNLPLMTCTRGRDLSASLEGAGGIGGLLARTDHSALNPQLSTSYYHCDGNGNITCLINTNQAIVAKYLYDPYGNILSQSGPLAAANLYRFSSKELHIASGLVYYLYRFYEPNLQRWINRDPIGEAWGLNLFEFVSDNPLSHFDAFGLQGVPATPSPNLDTCEKQQRKDIEAAMAQACSRIHQSCSDPDCMNVIADAAQGCKKKPKVQCAKPGDSECAKSGCGYALGDVITLCPQSAWPINGQNCPGNGGPMTLDCILVHELQHVGASGKNPDDANTLQKCLGCPYGEPHSKK